MVASDGGGTTPAVRECELLVIGGGPAGMASALTAARHGVAVTLVDERPTLGGQIYKQFGDGFVVADARALGRHYEEGSRLISAVQRSRVHVLTGATVWGIWGNDAYVHRDDAPPECIRTRCIIIAAGAYDRPVPFPGWTLPGVITAGGAQALAKVQRVAPGRRILMAGSGPLALSFAAELAHAGANVVMLAEAAPRPSVASLLRMARAYPGNATPLGDGVRYFSMLRTHHVTVRWSTMIRRAEGTTGVERAVIGRVDADWRPITGTEQVLDVDTVCVGYGLFPSNELARLCGCAHSYDEERGGLTAVRDEWMRSSVPGILVAGDGAGVSGSAVAIEEGRLAGIAAAMDTGHLATGDADVAASRPRTSLRRTARLRRALSRMYPVGAGIYDLAAGTTIICRCEEVSLDEISGALKSGVTDTQGVKSRTRAGMGLCQGRMCGRQVAAEVSRVTARSIADVPAFSSRPPVKPVPIATLAAERPERERPTVAV